MKNYFIRYTFIAGERGVSMLEASLAIPIILLFLLSGIDVLRYCQSASALSRSVSEAASWASHGDSILGQYENRKILKNRVIDIGLQAGIQINYDEITVCSIKTNDCEEGNDLSDGEPFVIKAVQPFKVLTLFGFSKIMEAKAANQVPSV